jgi:hypothetical protein
MASQTRSRLTPLLAFLLPFVVGTTLVALVGASLAPATGTPASEADPVPHVEIPVSAVCLSAALCANVFYQGEATAYADRALVARVRREWRQALARVGHATAVSAADRSSPLPDATPPALARLE